VPLVVSGVAGSAVTYSFTEGPSVISGTGVIDAGGSFAVVLDLSMFPDGAIAVKVVVTPPGGAPVTLTAPIGKSSVAPTPPTVTAATYANLATETSYLVTVRGQAGSIANVVITDTSSPISRVANGMDILDSTGQVVIPVDVSELIDGVLTITVTLTNGIGASTATVITETLDDVPPALTVNPVSSAITPSNVGGVSIAVSGERGATVAYGITDGVTTLTGSATFNGSGKTTFWSGSLAALKDGPITLTVTETDPARNPTVYTQNLVKKTAGPGAPSVSLNQADDSGVSATDNITNVANPRLIVTAASDAVSTTVYVGNAVYTGQTFATGTYSVTAVSVDAYGNTSASSTPWTLVIDATAPTGTVTVSNGRTVGTMVYVAGATASLALSFSGAPAGLATVSVSLDGGAYSAPVAYTANVSIAGLSANGTHTVSVMVTDKAGNSVIVSRTFTLDNTPPVISSSLTTPTNGTFYDISQKITLMFGATDAASGIATVQATLDGVAVTSGTAIVGETLAAGAHTVVITATDAVGNTSTSTVTFTVRATIAGLQAAVTYGVSSGYITSSSVASSMQSYLSAAQTALNANNHTLAKSDLASFVTQAGNKAVSSAYSTLLKGWANDLSSTL
jgi:hypothetical protein